VATLDPVGNPTQIVQTGAVSSTQTYGYDADDRILSVCFQAGTCPGASDPFIRWTYDAVGNRLTEDRPGAATLTYTYNALDQLTEAGATTYTYDHNGNQLSAGTTTMSYDLANRLSTLDSGSTTTTYAYDGDGGRLQASIGSQAADKTNYLWDIVNPLPMLALERDGANALLRRYVYGQRLISMTTGGSKYYYHFDTLGSMRNLTSSGGNTHWTDTYEPYGAIRTETKNNPSAPTNLMKFTAEYNDPTGLYHLRARQYDPVQGRFLSPDPVASSNAAASVPLYAYVANRPTVMVDPSGTTLRPANSGTSAAEMASTKTRACNGFWDLSLDCLWDTIQRDRAAIGRFAERHEIIFAVITAGIGGRAARPSTLAAKEGVGLSARTADNEALRNTLARLYKPDQRYAGGTAGALREEARTGIKVFGRNHRASAEQNVNALTKILAGERGPLSTRDRYTALRNLRDLEDAIRFFDSKRPGGYLR
jgi:RHS repeat-associated protein